MEINDSSAERKNLINFDSVDSKTRGDSVKRHYLLITAVFARIAIDGSAGFPELCKTYKVTNAIGRTMEELGIIERIGRCDRKGSGNSPIKYRWIGDDPSRVMAEKLVSTSSALTRKTRVKTALRKIGASSHGVDGIEASMARIEDMLSRLMLEFGI